MSLAQQTTWQRAYDPFGIYESAWGVCTTTDSCFIIVGTSTDLNNDRNAIALKINKYGDTLWNRRFIDLPYTSLYSCAPTYDGGCVFTGRAIVNNATRISSKGLVVWDKSFPGIINENTKLIRDMYGHFLMIGNSAGLGYATKFDSVGKLFWHKNFITGLVSVLNSKDSGYVFVGSISDGIGDTSNLYMAKTDTSGSLKWQSRHSVFSSGVNTQAADLYENGYIVGGTTADTNSIFQGINWFAIVGESGDVKVAKKIYTPTQEYFSDIKKCSYNRFVLLSNVTGFSRNAKATIYDGTGTVVVSRIWESDYFNSFRTVIELLNNNLLFAGIFESGPQYQQNDVFGSMTDSMLSSKPVHIINDLNLVEPSVELNQNFPNPFNASTIISFSISRRGHVVLYIVDLTGRVISTVIDEVKDSGRYVIEFENSQLPTGCYFCQLIYESSVSISKKLMIIK